MADRLDDPRVQAFLEEEKVVVLCTLTADGAPLAMPMWFLPDPAGLYMVSQDGIAKIRNLRRDPRVCVVAERGARNADMQGVIVRGHARFLERAQEYAPIAERLLARYEPDLAERWGGRAKPADRVVFQIVPERVRASWSRG